MRKVISILFIFLICSAVVNAAEQKAKNIILVIVDGGGVQEMGLLADYARYAPKSPYKDKTSNVEKFFNKSTLGLSLTNTYATLVTDSAAAGTQIATGKRTLPGSIGVDYEGKAQKTILEYARDAGKSTGLITTVYLQDATPSVFAAHQSNRGKKEDIAKDMLNANVDVMLGGGAEYFSPLYKDFQKNGYTLVQNKKDFNKVVPAKTNKLLAVFSNTEMPYVIDASKYKTVPTLTDMTSKALDILDKNENGFFIMVESGKPDWTLHANDAAAALQELIEFDQLMAYLDGWIAKRDDTLIIMTADHETGGFVFNYRNLSGTELNRAKESGEVLYGGKTDYVNFNVFDKLTAHREYLYFTEKEFEALPAAKQTSENIGKFLKRAVGHDIAPAIYENCSTFKCAKKNYDTSLGISWGTGAHSATPVQVAAYGVTQQNYGGMYHMTKINHKMMESFGFEAKNEDGK